MFEKFNAQEKNYTLKKYSSFKILYFGDWKLCTSKPTKGYIKKQKQNTKTLSAIR